jgi:hypothetical protein
MSHSFQKIKYHGLIKEPFHLVLSEYRVFEREFTVIASLWRSCYKRRHFPISIEKNNCFTDQSPLIGLGK